MHAKDRQFYTNDISSPGYIESTASSTRKSKEKLRVEQLIPSEILENSAGIKQLLDAYYTFMNLDEFIYAENEDFQDIVLDGKAVFRISDPRNENDTFFTDETGADSTMTVTDADGTITIIPLTAVNVHISNGNELPGSLAKLTSEIGKTFKVDNLASYNGYTAKLNTPIKNWVGPGPSHIMNNIERAMDIDNNSQAFLELMQKEIASVIPRDITVNKRNLYKNIVDYYKVRGSSDSIEIFFRLLFNDEVEVQYPWDKTLIPSSGNWDVNAALPKGGQYLDNKGQLSNVIKIQDSLRYQKYSYLIRTGQNVSTWENVFNRLVHPAGFKFFGEILIIMELSKAIMGEDVLEGDTLYRKVLSAMPERQPGAIGIEDVPILVEMFASIFLPSLEGKIHKTASINIPNSKIVNGVITGVEISNPGFGYTSTPTLTFNGIPESGQSIVSPVISIGLDSLGRLDVDNITITSGGSGFAQCFGSVSANSNSSKLAHISLAGTANKNFNTAPTIIISEPTAKDADGVLLTSNVQATAVFTLNSAKEITGYTITNAGSGYVTDPTVRIDSNANNEIRAKDLRPILILLLNHLSDSSRTDPQNDYFNNKGDSFIHSEKRYGYNETFQTLGSRSIQSTDTANINKYNVNSYIHTN